MTFSEFFSVVIALLNNILLHPLRVLTLPLTISICTFGECRTFSFLMLNVSELVVTVAISKKKKTCFKGFIHNWWPDALGPVMECHIMLESCNR